MIPLVLALVLPVLVVELVLLLRLLVSFDQRLLEQTFVVLLLLVAMAVVEVWALAYLVLVLGLLVVLQQDD